jgi:hypothetical protein
MDIATLWDGILALGRSYNVDPLVFAVIYVAGVPFFYLFLAWLIRNLKRGRSPVLPAALLGFVFLSSYLYVIVMGRNVPWWVYVLVALLVAVGGISLVIKVRKRLKA